jgi:hypothetical protein
MSFIISSHLEDLFSKNNFRKETWKISASTAVINVFKKDQDIFLEVVPCHIETPLTNLKKSFDDFLKTLRKL